MEKPLAQQIEELKKAIAAQDSIRALVGDAIADSTLGALRDQLALLEGLAVTPESSRDRRKVVTVMFAVIPNFAHLSEKMDVEDLMQLTNHVWQKLDRIILAQGGHIDKHQGDGVMALWGVDLAREDDAEQAVRAGLKMLETIQEIQSQHALDLHIAIHSGTVLLGEVGVQREYTAMGNTVNMASHLKDVTPIGCIYISAETNRLVRGLFEVEKLPALKLKGIQDAVEAYRVLRVYPHTFRPHTRGVEGIKTRMVGREVELSHLQDELNQALEKGHTRFTIVVGDAGLGKSRLLYEFEKWIEVQPQPLTVIKGRATESSMLTPYSLLRACLNNWIGVDESDPLAEMRAWLEQGVIDLFGGDESAAEKAYFERPAPDPRPRPLLPDPNPA
jgi:class 3 adenylate cyclase